MNLGSHQASMKLLLSSWKCGRCLNTAVYSTKAMTMASVKLPETSTQSTNSNSSSDLRKSSFMPHSYRTVYPEFLPDPKVEWRNAIREKLERSDMMDRRKLVEIPEFYVGSILRITTSDPHSAGKVSRFVGICIHRDRCGLRARCILRNVVDNQGLEVQYELYDPTIQKVEVLRLEKRLDDHLLYLRDALPEFSTFDMDMEPTYFDESAGVPINETKVILRPRPWLEKWERQNLHGIANIDEYLNEKRRRTAIQQQKPWEQFDLMQQYRATIPEEEQREIYTEIHEQLQQLDLQRKRKNRKHLYVKPTHLA